MAPSFVDLGADRRAALLLLLLLLLPAALLAQSFPLYHKYQSFDRDDPTTETWYLYPFYMDRETTQSQTHSFHPVFSKHRDTATGNRNVDALWPVFSYRYRPERSGARNYSRSFLFPLYFDKREERFGREMHDRFILPLWYEGSQEGRGQYKVLFPFLWYSYPQAQVPLPLFPPREQTFYAIWPLVGRFHGFWNRDRIQFFLWPLLVHSSEGTGEDYNQIHSFIWPVFSRYSGPKVSGFRVFPLVGYVQKDEEFKRGFFLWPLGHYRTGRISKDDEEQQDVKMLLPFYVKFRRPNISLDTVFPFYGRLRSGERESTGYGLAFYNRENNYRRGIREDRIGWFIYRRRVPMEGYAQEDVAEDATTGGGVFPFYTRFSNPTKTRVNFIWPIGYYKYNKYRDYEWERTYVTPFYSNQERRFNDGDLARNRFLFPFFRQVTSLDGSEYTNAMHLFFYTTAAPVDRLYAPLWTFWEKQRDIETGRRTTRVMKNAWISETLPDGSTKKQLNLLFVQYDKAEQAEGAEYGSTRILFGLFEKKRELGKDPELKLLGLKVF